MKKLIILTIIAALSIIYLLPTKGAASKEVSLVYKILNQSALVIKTKYNLDPIGSGASMFAGPLRKLNLAFNTESALTKDELRALLISSANEVVQLVNSNPDVLAILYEPPFTIKNVQIIIYNHDSNGNILYDPEIGVVEISNGKLDFSTNDRYSDAGYKNTTLETYEEAFKLTENI